MILYEGTYPTDLRWCETVRAFAEHPDVEFCYKMQVAGLTLDAGWCRELAAVASREELAGFALLPAARSGAIDLVRLAIEAGCDVNEDDVHDSLSAVLLAAKHGHSDIVELLARSGVDPNPGLVAAAYCGLTPLVQELYAFGADIEYVTPSDYLCGTPLCAAIQGGHVATTRLLLDSGAKKVAFEGEGEKPPLFFACEHLQFDIVQLLLEEKYETDVNARCRCINNRTALMACAMTTGKDGGYAETGARQLVSASIARLLLDHGRYERESAAMNAGDDDGKNAFEIAVEMGNEPVAKELRKGRLLNTL